jgi:hypothetical protein
MDGCGLIHPDIRPSVEVLITELYVFPEDIIEEIRKDGAAWENYERYPEPYRRIRIAYIDAARDRPDEYRKRLDNFISAAHDGRIIGGYGGVDKYYGSDRTKS